MKALGRLIVGLLAVIGALALVLAGVAFVQLRSAHLGSADAGGSPSSSSTTRPYAGGLVADTLSGQVIIPFAMIEQKAGPGVHLSDAGNGRLHLKGPMQALGREWQVEGDGDLAVEGNDVVVRPTTLSVAGLPGLDGLLGSIARSAIAVREPITGLPSGITVTGVKSSPEGLRADITGHQVPLPAPN